MASPIALVALLLAQLSGTLMDEQGRPVAGARVAVFTPPVAKELARTTSDRDGKFALEMSAPVGDLVIEHDGFAARTLRVSREETGPLILAKEADAPKHALLGGPSRTGRILDPQREKPIPWAEITLDGTPTKVFTDDDGRFRIEVAEGDVVIGAVHPDYAVQTVETAQRELTLHAVPTARIAGHVLDARGKPVVMASVIAVGTSPVVGAFSGPDGRFVLDDLLPSDEIRLRATKRGFERFESDATAVKPGERRMRTNVTLARGATLSGRVTDASGQPLRAEVHLRHAEDPELAELIASPLTVSADGEFSATIPRGRYEVRVTADGWASKQVETNVTGERARLDVELGRAVELRGQITRSGVGVEGVKIELLDNLSVSTSTDADGRFALTDVAAGTVRLGLRKPEEHVNATAEAEAPGEVAIELPALKVEGRVIDAVTRQPIRRYTITFENGPPSTFDTADGRFTLSRIPAGRVMLAFSAEGYADTHIVLTGQTELEVALSPGSVLHGVVTTPEGQPIGGAAVDVRVGDEPSGRFAAITDARGVYAVRGLPRGAAIVSVEAEQYAPFRGTLQFSGDVTRHDVVLRRGLDLHGRVVAADGTPLANAEVTAIAQSGQSTIATTNASGAFRLGGLAAGRYTLIARKAGFTPSTAAEVTVPATTPVTLALDGGAVIVGSISGIPSDARSFPLVVALGRTGAAVGKVEPTGRFRIEDVPLGRVEVVAQIETAKGLRKSRAVTVDVVAGAELRVELAFE